MALLTLAVAASGMAQVMPVPAHQRPLNFLIRQQAQLQEAPAKQETEPDVVVEVAPSPPATDPNELRLHLWDGNVITGQMGVTELMVVTEFGSLTIPVSRVVSLRPGLDSFPERQAEIARLVDELGAPDFQKRENARRALLGMGRLLHQEIYRFSDGDNVERKRHLDEIRKEFEQQIDDSDDDWESDDNLQPLIRQDQVETRDFTIVGKIEPAEFQIVSKYGPLTVRLADVRFADRQASGSLVRRTTVTVTGTDFAGNAMKSSGIRVEQGDQITVRASGSITMSPWGNQAVVTPDGNLAYGNLEGHGGGTLLGRIGESGELIKLGSRAMLIARKAGILQLGIAMQPDYAQQGYQFPGEYKVKLTIESTASE